MSKWLKILLACLAAWVFLAAVIALLSQATILGASQSAWGLALPLLLSFVACFIVGWANRKSLAFALVACAGGILIGLPVAFFILAPFGYSLAERLSPLSNLSLSGSLGGAWILLGIILAIEVLTDRVNRNRRWLMLSLSIPILMAIIYSAEIITSKYGLSTNTALLKMAFYGPVIWGGMVAATNIRDSVQRKKEEI